jgi:hypothetical protein
MNKLTIILILLSYFSFNQAKKNNSNSLYLKVLTLHLNSLANVNNDTILVQKDDFFQDELPNIVNKHPIKYLSSKEVDDYDGNSISLRKIFPIEVENDLLVIRIAYFGYSTKNKLWVSSGGSYYRFKYQCDNKKFIFLDKVEYGN